jgi:hypothetical protein
MARKAYSSTIQQATAHPQRVKEATKSIFFDVKA